MVSSAIRIKHARVSFSKSIKIARIRRTSRLFEVFEKLASACFIHSISRETILLRIKNIHKNVRDNCSVV